MSNLEKIIHVYPIILFIAEWTNVAVELTENIDVTTFISMDDEKIDRCIWMENM